MDNNDFKIRFVPILKQDGKQVNAKDIKTAILNDVAMLDDAGFTLAAHTRLVRINKAITEVFKNTDYKDTVSEAQQTIADLQKVKKVTVEDAEIAYGATYTKYDFNECMHPLHKFIVDIEAKFKDLRKEVEDELKAIPPLKQEIGETNFDTGEVTTIETGGKKRIILDTDDIKNRINFVINKAEVLLQNVEDTNGIFTVYPPVKVQSFGVKVTKV